MVVVLVLVLVVVLVLVLVVMVVVVVSVVLFVVYYMFELYCSIVPSYFDSLILVEEVLVTVAVELVLE
jgi:hypothetical protein